MKKLIFIISLLLLFGCSDGEDGSNGTNGIDGINGVDGTDGTGTTETGPVMTKYTPNGKLQKGPCPAGGEVLLLPLDNTNMKQSGEGPFIGFTINDFGKYYVPMEIERDASDDVYVEVYFKGNCHHELNGGDAHQEFTGIINTDDEINNINPLTNVRSYVARWLFGDTDLTAIYGDPESGTEGNIELSLVLAESKIITFLGMPDPLKKFTEMNLENGDTGDAVLALFNSLVLYMQDEGIYNDVLVKIGSAIIENDLALKSEIAGKLPLITVLSVKNNLENRYSDLGLDIDIPKIWNLGFHPDYYSDLLERTPEILEQSANIGITSTCSFDQSFTEFAYPYVFAPGIENSRYIGLKFPAGVTVSIWTVDGTPEPLAKVVDVVELKELLLNGPIQATYQGYLGENHGLTAGTQYYIKEVFPSGSAPSKVCTGANVAFGANLAKSPITGLWEGNGNGWTWGTKEINLYLVD